MMVNGSSRRFGLARGNEPAAAAASEQLLLPDMVQASSVQSPVRD